MKLHYFFCPFRSMSKKHSCCTLLIFVLRLLISQTASHAMPQNGNASPAAILPSGKSNRTLTLSTSSASSSTYPLGLSLSADRKQRFCLNRLKDALHVVCSSGSASTMPLYFNPGEYSSINDTNSVPFNGRGIARNLKNDIPAMAQPQRNRRVLRRRSRRNIVRECCEKPCSYNNLRRYCSSTTRTTGFHATNLRADNQPVYGASQFQSSALQQCVTVADLQTFYLKFFHKQWKKDSQARTLGSESVEISVDGDASSFTDSFSRQGKFEMKKEPLSPISPEPATDHESRVVNEIDEMEESDLNPQRIDQSGNIRTLPPILHFVNLPRGTNDDMY